MTSKKFLILFSSLVFGFFLNGCKESSPTGVASPGSTSPGSGGGGEGGDPEPDDGATPPVTAVTVESGDFVFVAERAGGTSSTEMRDGAIIVVDKDGNFKGTGLPRDVSQEILRYPRGLRIEKDPFADDYTLVYGTTNADLKMEAHKITPIFSPGQAIELSSSALATNTDSVSSHVFAFGLTGQNKSTGKRFLSDLVGGYPYIHSYMQGAAGALCYDYSSAGAGYAGWYIGGLFTGIGAFGVTDLYVARYKGGEWAIDVFNSSCSTPSLDLVSGDFGGSDVYVTDVNHFRSSGDGWDNDIFMTYRVGFGSPAVSRYDASAAYVVDYTPFTDSARAMFWQSDSAAGGNKIWTLEEDGSNYYIRRYDGSGTLEATVFTDTGKAIFHTSISAYMIRMPD